MNLFKRFVLCATLGASLSGPAVVAPVWLRTPLALAEPTYDTWITIRAGEPNRIWVRCLQHLLLARGYRLAADGTFGSQTVAAVKRFQSAHRLASDGIVGSKTWTLLCPTVRRGSRGEAVRALQVLLNGSADADVVPIDGVFGARTQKEVRARQRLLKVKATGVADGRLWMESLYASNNPF